MNESGDRLNLKEESQLSRLGEGLSRGTLTALEDKQRKDGSYFHLAKRRSEGRKEGRRGRGREQGRRGGSKGEEKKAERLEQSRVQKTAQEQMQPPGTP